MTMENNAGVQTRAMTGVQRREDGVQRQTEDDTERVQTAMPTTANGMGDPEVQEPARKAMKDNTENKIIMRLCEKRVFHQLRLVCTKFK